MKFAVLCAVLAFAAALVPITAQAQETRDPLIDPPSGGAGSRFQIVGQRGWTPGETVTIRIGFTRSPEPLAFSGPFPFERTVTVLRDGTWSFPVVVRDDVLGFPLGETPGFLVVRAESAGQTATNVYIFTVDGRLPAGTGAVASFGFGPGAPSAAAATLVALFGGGLGSLLCVSGALRRRDLRHGRLVEP